MPGPKKTVIALKSAFIKEQVRILSQQLEIPDDFREKSQLPNKILDSVIKERMYQPFLWVSMRLTTCSKSDLPTSQPFCVS